MNYFNLFGNIIVTKGNNRVLFSDLQKNNSDLFPLELYSVLEKLKLKSIDDVKKDYNKESSIFIDEYIKVLLEREYGFLTPKRVDESFPKMLFNFHEYSVINNIVLYFSSISNIEIIKSSIENLKVKHLLVFFDSKVCLDELIKIDNIFNNTLLQGIEFYVPYNESISLDFIEKLNIETIRIYSIVIYNCNSKVKIKNNFRFNIEFVEESLTLTSCGLVSLNYFNTNLPKIIESLNHNSCLNRKLSIDKEGNIKNCPSMPQNFGNIKDTSLEEALNHPDFKKYWNVTKDMIQVCKDCEFRHICTDCRAYTERTHFEGDIDLSKPLKCGYNPYTNEWAEWSTNPLKQKAIEFYGMQDLIKKDA